MPASDERSKILFMRWQWRKITIRLHFRLFKGLWTIKMWEEKSREWQTSWGRVQLPNLVNYNPHLVRAHLALNFCTAGTFFFFCLGGGNFVFFGANTGVRTRCTLTRRKILLSGLQGWWQTPSWEFLHGRGLPCHRHPLLGLPSQRRSGYKSIEGNCMQMWPSVELPSSLQFRAVCSIFIQVT